MLHLADHNILLRNLLTFHVGYESADQLVVSFQALEVIELLLGVVTGV